MVFILMGRTLEPRFLLLVNIIQNIRELVNYGAIINLFHTQGAESIDYQCVHSRLAAAEAIVIIIVPDINAPTGLHGRFLQGQIKDPGVRLAAVCFTGNNQMVEKINQSGSV